MFLVPVGTTLRRCNPLTRGRVTQNTLHVPVPSPRPAEAVSAMAMQSSSLTGPYPFAKERSSPEGTPQPALPAESTPTVGLGNPHPWHERFDLVEDKPIHRRYMALYDRVVRFTPDGSEPHCIHYDVVGHPSMDFRFAVAFPFHPATDTTPAQVTVVREYAQGPNYLMYCLPTGGFDARKHTCLRECAEAEMAEEAMLYGGEVVPLLPEEHPGQSELKWSRNSFKPFLFIDPKPAPNGHAVRDAEEHTIEVLRVTIAEFKQIIKSGQLMLPSVYAAFLGLEVLSERKLI